MRMPIFISFLLCTVMLGACGKKGSLYLPENDKQASSQLNLTTQATTQERT